jgi:hypothetical protein
LLVIRVISGDNELQAMDFQKHYRMNALYLMDPNRAFERKYNRNGWPFLMLVDEQGTIVYQCNNLAERDKKLMQQLYKIGKTPRKLSIAQIGETPYLQTTVENNTISDTSLNERFPSIACGADGSIYTVYTSATNDHCDVYLRIQKDGSEEELLPVAATEADEYDATVIADSNGKVWICWTSNARGRTYNIYLTSLDDLRNNKPSVPVSLSKQDAMHGRMAADSNGKLWITYYQWENIKNISRDKEIYLRAYADGKISDEIHISPTDVSEYEDHTDSSIALINDQPVVCWSWDFHTPKGYTQDAHSPTIFARSLTGNSLLPKPFDISAKNIDMTPTLAAHGNALWCAWDSLGRSSKSLCLRSITGTSAAGNITTIAADLVNICSPDFAFNDTKGCLTWSQTKDGRNWSLWKSEYIIQTKTWGQPSELVSEDNPRFASCAYDIQGRLWLAYSGQTSKGRQIVVKPVD